MIFLIYLFIGLGYGSVVKPKGLWKTIMVFIDWPVVLGRMIGEFALTDRD